MNIEIKTLLIIIVFSVLVGFIVCGLLFFDNKPLPVAVFSPETTLYRVDTLKIQDTLYVRKSDTIIITNTTTLGTIPWRFKENLDSLVLSIENQKYWIPFRLKRWFKGLDGGYEITTISRVYGVVPPQKEGFIRPYLSVDFNYIPDDKKFKSGIEMGLSIKSISLYLRTDYYKKIIPQGGIKWQKRW